MKKLLLPALLAGMLAACGGDDGSTTGNDGGVGSDAGVTSTTDGAAASFNLYSGTYKVTQFQNGVDGCMVQSATDGFTGKTFTVSYDPNGTVSVFGAVSSFGTGKLSGTSGTLTAPEQMVTDADVTTCTYKDDVSSVLTLTADYTFTLQVSEEETTRTNSCVNPSGDHCTSTWTLFMTYLSPADGGT